jgi:hypothetical protein
MFGAIISALSFILEILSKGYNYFRTPRSEVSLSVSERDEPYRATKSNVKFRAPSVRIYNEGERVAFIENVDVSAEFLDSERGGSLDDSDLQDNISVNIRRIGKAIKLGSDSPRERHATVDIDSITKLPPEFKLRITYIFQIKDNVGEYEVSEPTEFEIINKTTTR